MKLNRNERARLEQTRAWARSELRKELEMQADPVLGPMVEKLKALVPPGMDIDIFMGARQVTWLLKLIDREQGTDQTAAKFLKAVERAPTD